MSSSLAAQTLVGAIISNFTSCASIHEWFTPGLCDSHRDQGAQVASLYYSFAVDVLSDLMSMDANETRIFVFKTRADLF